MVEWRAFRASAGAAEYELYDYQVDPLETSQIRDGQYRAVRAQVPRFDLLLGHSDHKALKERHAEVVVDYQDRHGREHSETFEGFPAAVVQHENDHLDGLFFFSTNGRQANPWGSGTSYQCVVPPVRRTPVIAAGGGAVNACWGWFSIDLNAHWTAKPNHNPGAGAAGAQQSGCQRGIRYSG